MPSIELKTNFELKDAREFAVGFSKVCLFLAESHLVSIRSGISKEMATILSRPEGYIRVHHTYKPTLAFAGTLDLLSVLIGKIHY